MKKGFIKILSLIMSITMLFGVVFALNFSTSALDDDFVVTDLEIGETKQITDTITKQTADGKFAYKRSIEVTRLENDFYGDPVYSYGDGFITITSFLGAKNQAEVEDATHPKTKYTSVIVPDEIEGYPVITLDKKAFANNQFIETVSLPACLTNVRDACFEGCSNFLHLIVHSEEINIGTNALPIETVGDFEFYKYTLVSDTTEEGIAVVNKYIKEPDYVHNDETGEAILIMQDVTVPEIIKLNDNYSVRVIGLEAFLNRVDVKSVTLPETVTKIEYGAFSGCSNMSRFDMGNSVVSIGEKSFYQCSSLEGISLSNSLKIIGESAFEDCTSLKGNTIIENSYLPQGIDPKKPNALFLPSSLEEIDSHAFAQCESLLSVYVSQGITEIKNNTFVGCKDLVYVDLPESLETLELAFSDAFTSHTDNSDYVPVIFIRSPHVVFEGIETIEDCSKLTFDKHLVFHGAKYSSTYELVDMMNQYYKDKLLGEEGTIFEGLVKPHIMVFEPIEVQGHTFTGVVTEPTCLTSGYTEYSCSCDFVNKDGEKPVYIADRVDALGHDLGEVVTVSNPTCQSVGTTKQVCKRENCGKTIYNSIPVIDHNWQFNCTATCTTKGVTWKECSMCHTKKDSKNYPLGLGHQWVEIETTQEWVQCEQDGKYIRQCALCEQEEAYTVLAHTDANNDFYCDICLEYVGTSDMSPDKNCSCNCHAQTGIKPIIYTIQLFFWKLLGTNKVCDCGVAHYAKGVLG